MTNYGEKFDLSDEQWSIISKTLKDEKLRPGPTFRRSYRDYLNGIFYRARSGCTWKQVPKRYGRGDRCCHWYSDWYEKGLLHVILVELSEDLKARAGVRFYDVVSSLGEIRPRVADEDRDKCILSVLYDKPAWAIGLVLLLDRQPFCSFFRDVRGLNPRRPNKRYWELKYLCGRA